MAFRTDLYIIVIKTTPQNKNKQTNKTPPEPKAGSVVQEGKLSLWMLESYFLTELWTGGTNQSIVTVQSRESQSFQL